MKNSENPLFSACLKAADALEASGKNLRAMLGSGDSELILNSVGELHDRELWSEFVDRFYKTLEFGTGGLRGRSIGKHVTESELGTPVGPRPQFPCVGTNAMNYYNVSRATQGLCAYMLEWHAAKGRSGRPSIAIAHDTRHFSKEFADLAAGIAVEMGCDAFVFDGPRSTPELSFTVRKLRATAGVVVTASHNPKHDNGYKVYFEDGAQILGAHARGIVEKVSAVAGERVQPAAVKGTLTVLGAEVDAAYMDRLETLLLDREMVAQAELKVVFSSIHGVGGHIIRPMLKRLGFSFSTVAVQDAGDGDFPTVKSPNPENAEALKLAVEQVEREGADVVIATDPDCDRMGVAIRNREGKMQLLTGNQIGSLIAAYRVQKLDGTLIHDGNRARCAIIKTLVTTDLQKAIAEAHGLKCVETLTGFKYIGEKLGQYEVALGDVGDYRTLSEAETRDLRLARSAYYVAGGEESYGYSAHDFVRDKDGNAAAVLFAEVCAWAKQRKQTVDVLLDEVYARYGLYIERNETITYAGASGSAIIGKLAASFAATPPAEMDGAKVVQVRDFSRDTFTDSEGQTLPKEKMVIFDLADGRRVAVRPSGTEPKIKFYLFSKKDPKQTPLAQAKADAARELESLWKWIAADVEKRR